MVVVVVVVVVKLLLLFVPYPSWHQLLEVNQDNPFGSFFLLQRRIGKARWR